MSLQNDFERRLFDRLAAGGPILNDAYSRLRVEAVAQECLFELVSKEFHNHIHVEVRQGEGKSWSLEIAPLTLYGCDLIEEIWPTKHYEMDQARARITAAMQLVSDPPVIH